jgi:hypothetical protein
MPVQDVHFHCPTCHPQLMVGSTPAICGRTIRPLVVGGGRERKCGGCKARRRDHRHR